MIAERSGDAIDDASILIVDDEVGVVRLLERALRAGGFTQVESTTDPYEFLERFQRGRFDLLMLDLSMPGLSGQDLLDRLSAEIPQDEFLPRIVLTGEREREPRQRALSSGATEFLTKPVDLLEIVLRVRNLLATRRLHQALKEEKRTLEVKVEERTRDLRRANEEAVDRLQKQLQAQEERSQVEEELQHAVKLEALGQLAASVAHDFNNLLSVIMNFAHFAREDIGADHPALADVREITTAARSASMLTRQLLMFSRKEVTKPEVLEADAVVEEILPLLASVMKGRHRIETDLGAPEAHVKIPRGHLEQVLMNLAVNARDAMTEAAGVLTIRTASESAAGTQEPRWTATVTDTGSGMPEDVRARVFEPFFTTKGQGRGTGLGLATTHRVITRARGSITVDSRPGIGTTFAISLPLTTAQARSVRPVMTLEEGGRGEVILVVADDAALRAAMERTLVTHGYVPMLAGTGAEALEGPLSDGHDVDLLIADLLIADMTGPELAARAGVPTLFMSTYAEYVLEESDVLDSGARVLAKPFEPEDLLVHVRTALEDQGSIRAALGR